MDRANKPSALMPVSPGIPQAQISISNKRVNAVLPTGESIEVLLYGATIISWKDTAGQEKLWLSEAAVLDGSKAVRGGIPVVFPVFGKDDGHDATAKLPQHGFARNSVWEFLGKSTSESSRTKDGGDSSVKLDFGLSGSNLDAEVKKAWGYDFGLIYSVTLSKEGLGTSMTVRNEGEGAWEFQVLLHSYLRVKDINKVSIQGTAAASYIDKLTTPISTNTAPEGTLTITEKVDRVYTPVEATTTVLEGGEKKYVVKRDNMNQVVIWNPWTDAASMGDFSPKDGYKQMICVEAGAVNGWQKLEAGETWEGGQFISI